MGQLDDAVKAYRASQDALAAAERDAKVRIEAARHASTAARVRLAEAIVAAARAGMRQVDVIRTTGYSRERVRTILREGGIEPE
jgi:hypothetical protein